MHLGRQQHFLQNVSDALGFLSAHWISTPNGLRPTLLLNLHLKSFLRIMINQAVAVFRMLDFMIAAPFPFWRVFLLHLPVPCLDQHIPGTAIGVHRTLWRLHDRSLAKTRLFDSCVSIAFLRSSAGYQLHCSGDGILVSFWGKDKMNMIWCNDKIEDGQPKLHFSFEEEFHPTVAIFGKF